MPNKLSIGLFDRIAQALLDGDRVELRDFGVFSPRMREARTGRNPRTGKVVEVPAKVIPRFKAGQGLHKALNGDPEALATLRRARAARRERLLERKDRREGQLSLF